MLTLQDDLDAEEEVLLDPNTLSEDGTVALSTYSISKDGNYIAYGLSESGSDWVSIHVMSITNKQPMPDKLSWVSSCNLPLDCQRFSFPLCYSSASWFF
jgi:prolyl oligopeptidase